MCEPVIIATTRSGMEMELDNTKSSDPNSRQHALSLEQIRNVSNDGIDPTDNQATAATTSKFQKLHQHQQGTVAEHQTSAAAGKRLLDKARSDQHL